MPSPISSRALAPSSNCIPTLAGKALRLAALGLLLPFLCASCADLSAVAKFADSAKAASTGFADIAKDFAGSSTRRAQYVRDEEKPAVLKQTQDYKALEPDMLAAQKVLADYIAALAAISTDSTTSRDTSIQATAPGLERIHMTSTQAGAGVGLAAKVADALSAGYRSDKAAKVIHDSNPQLQEYLKGLEQIAGTDYPLALDLERLSAQAYYGDLLHKYGEKEPLAAITIRQQMSQDLAAIDARKKAAAAYVKILTDIGQGHQKLYDGGQHITARQMETIVQPYIFDIATQSIKVAKAY